MCVFVRICVAEGFVFLVRFKILGGLVVMMGGLCFVVEVFEFGFIRVILMGSMRV